MMMFPNVIYNHAENQSSMYSSLHKADAFEYQQEQAKNLKNGQAKNGIKTHKRATQDVNKSSSFLPPIKKPTLSQTESNFGLNNRAMLNDFMSSCHQQANNSLFMNMPGLAQLPGLVNNQVATESLKHLLSTCMDHNTLNAAAVAAATAALTNKNYLNNYLCSNAFNQFGNQSQMPAQQNANFLPQLVNNASHTHHPAPFCFDKVKFYYIKKNLGFKLNFI
jgi:hypothetical protein